jgi:hypothetical protein
MKNLSHLLIITFFLLSSLFLFANPQKQDSESPFTRCEKTYIMSDHIHICEEGIFILLHGIWYQTSGIQFDNNGLFFNTIYPENVSWICPVCGQSNSHYKKICSQCGAERPMRFQ